MQKAALSATMVAASLFLTASSSFGVVLYDSNGFEASAGYVANQFLQGQPASGPVENRWVQSPSFPTGATGPAATVPYAAVFQYAAPTAPNLQYVQVGDTNVPATNANFFNPQTNVFAPFTPAPSQGIAITWTMNTLSTSVANNPFFGISVYGDGTEVAFAGIDASTGQIVGGGNLVTVSPFTAAPDTFYQYELLLNYDTKSYSVFTGDIVGGVSQPFVLRAVGSFTNLGVTSFTDADITSFSANPGSGLNYSGFANFDNYKVETVTVPEPAALGLAGVAFGLLATRRRVSSR